MTNQMVFSTRVERKYQQVNMVGAMIVCKVSVMSWVDQKMLTYSYISKSYKKWNSQSLVNSC